MAKRRAKIGDLNYLAIAQYPLLVGFEQWATSRPAYTWLINNVPEWALPFSAGIAAATLFYDLFFRPQSRIREIWHALFDAFEVDRIYVGWTIDDAPDDLAVRAIVRFRRRIRGGSFWLRVYQGVNNGKEPRETVIFLEAVHGAPKGLEKKILVATIGVPSPAGMRTVNGAGQGVAMGTSDISCQAPITWPFLSSTAYC